MKKISSVLENYPDYEVTIGIEVHVQLTTNSKIFCPCPTQDAPNPNSNICAICTGQPGTLPVLNKKVVDYAIMAGLATHCAITPESFFARKHYFYPDLPKNYQITQSDTPICTNGFISIFQEDGSEKKIRLMRIHMEEDAGKSIHTGNSKESFVDFNRAGTPLLEIVSYPDIASTYQAKAYLKALHTLVRYLGICSGNMEEGAFRADTNISVRKKGQKEYGTRCELKNINSFKFIGDAIEYEIERQIDIVERQERVKQETRLWDAQKKETRSMRSKEEAADYRYFEDPDLPIISVDPAWVQDIQSKLPELPFAKYQRFMNNFHTTAYETEILVEDPYLADYFEQAYAIVPSKQLVNWILRDVLGYLKEHKLSISEFKIRPDLLARIIQLLDESKINNHAAKQVFDIVATTGNNPDAIVKEHNLEQIDSTAELEQLIQTIIKESPEQVAGYKAGNMRMMGYFVGQAMQKTAGKANPQRIQELLKKYL